MKKIIVALICFVLLFVGVKKGSAQSLNENLINPGDIQWNQTTEIFSYEKGISLEKDKYYTFVVSFHFMGDAINPSPLKLNGTKMNVSCKTDTLEDVEINFTLEMTEFNLFYASAKPTKDCKLSIVDFGARGYTDATLPRSEVLFYQGTYANFHGFQKYESFDKDVKPITNGKIDIYTNYDKPVSLDNIESAIQIYDNEDGWNKYTLSKVSDTYSDNLSLGEHIVTYTTKDTHDNEVNFSVHIHVVDVTPPQIIGEDTISWNASDACPSAKDILKNYIACDNCDGEILNGVSIKESDLDTYQNGKASTYSITLQASDKSGNKTERVVTLDATDITPPELELKDVTIKLSELGTYFIENVCDLVMVRYADDSGYCRISYSKEELTGSQGFSGQYLITVTATDKSNNKTVKTANLKIVDDLAPEIYLESYLLDTSPTKPYSLLEMKKMIQERLDQNGILYKDVEIISCDYLGNENMPGNYKMKYMYEYEDSIVYEVATIQVNKAENNAYYWFFSLLAIPVGVGVFFIVKRKKSLCE